MNRRLPFLLLTLVLLLPLLGLGWMGWRLGLEQRHVWDRQLSGLLERRLEVLREQARQPLDAVAQRTDAALQGVAGSASPADIAAQLSALPFVEQLLLLGPGGDLRWPDPTAATAGQRDFLQRVEPLWQGKALLHAGPRDAEGSEAPARIAARSGWLAWHWGQGMELLYWQRDPRRGVAAITVDRVGLLADIIAALPGGGEVRNEAFELRDEHGRALYQWGGYRPGPEQPARAGLALAPPLEGWRLVSYFDDSQLRVQGGRLQRLQLAIGLGTLALVLLGLGLWLFRELRRAAREARERVNFVNQVSHELRTPLTNIRLYAELLEDSVAGDPAAQRKLGVIVGESRRLGRLIGNVLSFARQQKKTLKLHRVPASLDTLVAEVVEQFRPGLEARGIRVTLDCAVAEPCMLDADAVTGIIGNLLSNAEKYAPNAPLRVETRESAGRARVVVQDGGPGVPRRYRRRIFRPFFRGSDKLTEGVSGTGIGLSIASELARLHGGALRLVTASTGARFELELPVERDDGV